MRNDYYERKRQKAEETTVLFCKVSIFIGSAIAGHTLLQFLKSFIG